MLPGVDPKTPDPELTQSIPPETTVLGPSCRCGRSWQRQQDGHFGVARMDRPGLEEDAGSDSVMTRSPGIANGNGP
jgi:hypothetical protein